MMFSTQNSTMEEYLKYQGINILMRISYPCGNLRIYNVHFPNAPYLSISILTSFGMLLNAPYRTISI